MTQPLKVVIDGVEYIQKPELKQAHPIPPVADVRANNDEEAFRLWHKFEPLCPECGARAFPTNFSAESLGGKKNDKSVVWFCSDNGHCAFSIGKDVKWRRKQKATQGARHDD